VRDLYDLLCGLWGMLLWLLDGLSYLGQLAGLG
jgi:hypothetical protein